MSNKTKILKLWNYGVGGNLLQNEVKKGIANTYLYIPLFIEIVVFLQLK